MSSDTTIIEFREKSDAVINCQFILSQQKISDLLKLIAVNNELFALFDNCMQGFNLDSDYERSVVEMPQGRHFQLPLGTRRLVALVFYMLYEFDNGTRNIVDFIVEFYPSNNVNSSFSIMCEHIIIPFKEAVISMLNGVIGNDEIVEEIDNAPEVPDGAVTETEYILRNISAIIMEDAVIEKSVKEDYLLLIDGLYYALEVRNIKLVKVLFIGFRYAFNSYKPVLKKLKDIEACLKLYLVL